ncbi:hypothetical protein [Nocardia sp. NPDC058114]|uniref:hypothetical protein n=1 Tax=Nocardia sp. NPDC058114 TaxID=3346346 RepID=UPI0036DBB208
MLDPTMSCIIVCEGCPYRAFEIGLEGALDVAREHNDQHVEFPGDWGYERTPGGKWRRTRS